ncbi:pyruvate dehydrogenase (acetyl-transferring) E1 component subunit alpha [Nocardioides sp. T2.26MG-1]|uniref:pyruvate dehydrogenase (acetyl-transferring) E1 component subunit alpha n=1 Tax=Nocardioides sp. T2.26MG-1 TaxID=3041166 RepID=UPI00247732F5|nr:pyruvate dehydrogenase (acetyl-transferring) E1 component subunit alpha [Nocardioides sp. T2.26MG-1]CAI9404372.1 Acetoin:2,6-dichlorophenolindophenol oxidoreductase subunit alpha [Nocardioides sp. T2.26MG-1]
MTTDPLDLLATMLLVRRFEERCAELYSGGQIRGFLHLYVGEEAVAAGVCSALGEDDSVVSTYREHGHALARGAEPEALMAEMFGKVTGCSRGRGGSMHLFDRSLRFVGGNAVVGGGLPLAVGLALGDALQHRPGVTACFFGDGAMAEGEFHESLNLAVLWRLPVLFCCENNRYAMGTAISKEHGRTELALRAASYGAAAWPVDGMDAVAVAEAAEQAVAEIRGGGGPVFLELQTYRFRAHSMYDPDRYRAKDEIAHWRERDPIELLGQRLRADGRLTDETLARMDEEVMARITAAVDQAAGEPDEPVTDLTRFVYSDGSTAAVAGGPR